MRYINTYETMLGMRLSELDKLKIEVGSYVISDKIVADWALNRLITKEVGKVMDISFHHEHQDLMCEVLYEYIPEKLKSQFEYEPGYKNNTYIILIPYEKLRKASKEEIDDFETKISARKYNL